ncbi:hypothetical protein HAX54_017546, partial [Datura stramonium]|nr:hypothetical protein [Datura stramonium]
PLLEDETPFPLSCGEDIVPRSYNKSMILPHSTNLDMILASSLTTHMVKLRIEEIEDYEQRNLTGESCA